MLQSILDNSIEYVQEKNIENNDLDLESSVYHLKLFNVEVAITLGNINREYASKGILYCPVYLIISKTKFEKIGYYEFYSSDISVLLDKEGDMDVSIMEGPLVYDYVDFDYLTSLVIKSKFLNEFIIEDEEFIKSTSVDEEEILKQASKISMEEKKNQILNNIESIENIDKILQKFEGNYNKKLNQKLLQTYKTQVKSSIVTENSMYLQQYYDTNKFGLIDNEGGGDCFFATIRDALIDLDIIINVESIRYILSQNITQEHFTNYSTMFNSLSSEITELTKRNNEKLREIKEVVRNYKELSEKTKEEMKKPDTDRNIIQSNGNLLKNLKQNHKDLKLSRERTVTELKNALANIQEFKFMKNVNNLEDFRTVIKSSNYWADSFAISLLEYIFNIKVIILSKSSYKTRNHKKLILCSDMILAEIEKNNDFKPKYYVIVEFDDESKHYKLVTYNTKKIFTFYEIPHGIKENIVDICMKNDKGLYNRIPNFVDFKQDLVPLDDVKTMIEEINTNIEENKMEEYDSKKREIEPIMQTMTATRLSYLPSIVEIGQIKLSEQKKSLEEMKSF